jgi:hypothetical protein
MCRRHYEIQGARRVACSKFHAEDPQVLGATVENLVATATLLPYDRRVCAFLS